MKPLKITCTEKYVLLDQAFEFDFPVDYTEFKQLTQEQFATQVFDQDVLIISDLDINETILKNNPNLKLVALCSTGFNHVNMPLLRQHGIQVCNIRGYAGDAVAEHAFTFMIYLIKNFGQQLQGVLEDKWSTGDSSFHLAAPMRELKGKTLTIIGKGEIGLSLAQKAEAFGMHVLFSERKGATTCRQGYVSFEKAIQTADIVSLHCELNQQTHHLIDASVLKMMKPNSLLINVGRGGLVDANAIVAAIESGELAGYAADVLDQEPPPVDHPLLNLHKQHANVLITGHIAWGTDEAQQRLFLTIQDNINKNMQGIEQNLV
ncbi:NAD(P)-dependent oxidoreductase [Acinetobacter soli]|uniref:NAD(P)-dependent oxidoreductase n=1 Tax=Acinetobacter soli TaxID=487316 RepID=UPI000E6ADA10|nr:NAD(P)-dependent oxidoreductase [Acinetobacter soli]